MNGQDYEFIHIDEAAGADWTAIQLVQPNLKKRKGVTLIGPPVIVQRRPWWKFFQVVRIGRSLMIFSKRSTWKISWAILAAVFLAGCAMPCTYRGKAVPKADAERMKALGMDVVCP